MISLTAGHSRKLVIVSRFCSREAVTRVGRRRPGEPLSTAPTARSPRQYRRGYDASPIRMAAPFAPCSAEFARLWRAAIPCRQRATRRSRVGTLPRADTARTGARPDFSRLVLCQGPILQEQGPDPIFRGLTIRLRDTLLCSDRLPFGSACRDGCAPSCFAPGLREPRDAPATGSRLGLPGRLRPTFFSRRLSRIKVSVRYRLSALPLRISSANGRRRGTACA